jgi:hypothetical protein
LESIQRCLSQKHLIRDSFRKWRALLKDRARNRQLLKIFTYRDLSNAFRKWAQILANFKTLRNLAAILLRMILRQAWTKLKTYPLARPTIVEHELEAPQQKQRKSSICDCM